MSSCAVCRDMSQCYKCQIVDLKKQVLALKIELKHNSKESNKQLIKPDATKHFELDNKFLPIRYYGLQADYGFLTITYDSAKFGLFNLVKDEQNYIFYVLNKAIEDGYIVQLTGCFEYQKNTTTHAHLIIKSDYNNQQIEDYFRPYFTDDKKNKYAIKCYTLQKTKCESYLVKESTEYYRYDPLRGLDDGIDDASPFDDCRSKCIGSLKDIFNALTIIDTSNYESLKLFGARLLRKYEIPDMTINQLLQQYEQYKSSSDSVINIS